MESEAQNQEQVIDVNEHLSDSPPSRKRLSFADEDVEQDSSSSDYDPRHLTRSDALMGHGQWTRSWGAKEPMKYDAQPMSESDDDQDKDLAWFFKKHHPDIDKYSQIAWCRTFANCLAAQIPKNRPTTYNKIKKQKL